MKGVLNFFNIIIFPIALICGVFISWEYFWLMLAIYSSLMLANSTIFSVVNAFAFKGSDDFANIFWRMFFTVLSAVCWTFVII